MGEPSLASALTRIPHLQLFPFEPLSRHTRFALGGPARLLVDVATIPALSAALDVLRESRHPFLLIGGGTNLVVSDHGFDGIVLRYRAENLELDGPTITAGAGLDLEALVDASVRAGLAGMEALKRIPGWVGAAIYGHAGAYGQQISDCLVSVTVHDGVSVRTLSREACEFRYRTSLFKQHRDWVILEAKFQMSLGDASALAARAEEIRTVRDEKFPPTLRCAGSTFKNCLLADLPATVQERVPGGMVKGGKVPAAWFLEQVGAKGMRRGGIHVADYHANLLFNDGQGRATELIALIDHLKQLVYREFTVLLEEEVQYVGFPDRISY